MIKESREKFIAEIMIRRKVRKILEGKQDKVLEFRKMKNEDQMVRQAIRSLIREAKKSPIPHDNTGINVLEDTLKKIMPIIKDSYYTLTSNPQQRKSFRAHIINGFVNALQPYRNVAGLDLNPTSGEEGELLARPIAEDEGDLEMGIDGVADDAIPGGDIDANDDGIPDAQQKFIETDPEKEKEAEVSPEEQEMDAFSVDGEDTTGRNMALETFKKIEKNITDAYNLLDTRTDKNAFYDYGVTNLKLYFDRYEDELRTNTPESTEGAPFEN